MEYVVAFVGWVIDWLLIIGFAGFGVMIASIISPSSKPLRWILGGAGVVLIAVILGGIIPKGIDENVYLGRLYLSLGKSVWGWLTFLASIIGNVDVVRRLYRLAVHDGPNQSNSAGV